MLSDSLIVLIDVRIISNSSGNIEHRIERYIWQHHQDQVDFNATLYVGNSGTGAKGRCNQQHLPVQAQVFCLQEH